MPSIDMPLEQLKQYKPPTYAATDFDSYWSSTINAAVRQPLNAELIPVNLPSRGVETFAVRFDGFEGGRVAGWYLRPMTTEKVPGLCVYHGYSGRGPRPLELMNIAFQGIAVLSMDCRGQNGQSQDAAVYPEGHVAGWMTKGIRNPSKYYYRYVYADAVRALELLAHRDEVDEKRLAVTGASQGGGLTLAVAALSQRPILAMADIPFLCDFRRAVAITPAGPYPEIAHFCKAFPAEVDQAFLTLSYIDNLNLASRIRCRTVISNCLWDDICPPSTIFGVYSHISAEKSMNVYPYHKHEVPYEHAEVRWRLMHEMLLD